MAASGARQGVPLRAARAPALDESRIAAAFERVPGLVDVLRAAAPYASVDDVMRRAAQLVGAMSEDERVALLDAHPRIGADRAGLSAVSAHEQGDAADAATTRELAALNDEYERRFGFRFVVFVAARPKAEILPVLRERVEQTRDEELATGLDEFLAIARDRLSRA